MVVSFFYGLCALQPYTKFIWIQCLSTRCDTLQWAFESTNDKTNDFELLFEETSLLIYLCYLLWTFRYHRQTIFVVIISVSCGMFYCAASSFDFLILYCRKHFFNAIRVLLLLLCVFSVPCTRRHVHSTRPNGTISEICATLCTFCFFVIWNRFIVMQFFRCEQVWNSHSGVGRPKVEQSLDLFFYLLEIVSLL